MEIYNKGKLMKLDAYHYLDQINGKTIISIQAGSMRKYLKSEYNLEFHQYYNLVMGYDKDYHPKCRVCGKPCKYRGSLLGWSRFCGSKCRSKDPEIIKEFSDRARKSAVYQWKHYRDKMIQARIDKMKDPDYKKHQLEISFHSVYGFAKGAWSNFMNLGNPEDFAFFYLAVYNSKRKFKYGVSTDIKNRIARSYMVGDKYRSVHILVRGTRRYIADLEFELKIYLNDRNEHIEWSRLRDVLLFIKDYIKKSNDHPEME